MLAIQKCMHMIKGYNKKCMCAKKHVLLRKKNKQIKNSNITAWTNVLEKVSSELFGANSTGHRITTIIR